MAILLIDNYDSFTYNLYQLLQAQTQERVDVVRNDAITVEEALAPSREVSRIVLSPGPGHPDVPADFGVCRALLQHQPQHLKPMLGVCLGHQGLASVWGGKVVPAPQLMHGKSSPVQVLVPEAPLFQGLPQPFEAMRYHSWTVEEASLPECLMITAKDLDHGLIMGLQHRTLPLHGVQFHPESIGTPQGALILKRFLELPA
jgi:anthranilate synthase/aminodeoxychorismate synthase-like glutamine amidotransferase